ncbi:hypothetical protein C6Y44_23265 [Rhodococcus rhodochrous]|nr:hypothetical protein C6Y44_23265 [Rhodococcus rhodochrous]
MPVAPLPAFREEIDMAIRSTSQMGASRTASSTRRPARTEQDGPSFTEVIHSQLFSNYQVPRGQVQRSA